MIYDMIKIAYNYYKNLKNRKNIIHILTFYILIRDINFIIYQIIIKKNKL